MMDLHFIIKCFPVNPENLCRFGFVVVGPFQHFLDCEFFGLPGYLFKIAGQCTIERYFEEGTPVFGRLPDLFRETDQFNFAPISFAPVRFTLVSVEPDKSAFVRF